MEFIFNIQLLLHRCYFLAASMQRHHATPSVSSPQLAEELKPTASTPRDARAPDLHWQLIGNCRRTSSMRTRFVSALLAVVAMALSTSAMAQETWLEVIHFPHGYGVFMREGDREDRSTWVVTNQETLARVLLLSESGLFDLKSALNKKPRANYLLLLENREMRAGSYIVAIDKAPSKRVWQQPYFNRYLATRSLSDILHDRQAAQKIAISAKTITSIHYKTIVQVGNRYTESMTKPVGQDLEIVPLNDPGTRAHGQVAEFQVLFKGDPLAGKEVTTLCRVLNEGRSQIYHTDPKGRMMLPIDKDGVWIVQTAYAHPSEDANYDWRIYEAMLTFTTH